MECALAAMRVGDMQIKQIGEVNNALLEKRRNQAASKAGSNK